METTAIKERPILFSGPMVTAIIEGKKTQTRRVVKGVMPWVTHVERDPSGADDCLPWAFKGDGERHAGFDRCPYGVPGDRLWVREAFAMIPDYDILDDGTGTQIPCGYKEVYRADDESAASDHGVTWKPSIHMPHGLHRLTLEITDVRVERLNDITEEDARAEGVDPAPHPMYPALKAGGHVRAFAGLWDKINGRAHPWESNPWVWIIEFKRVDTEAR